MSPSFLNLRELRRRSKASFRTENSTDASSDGAVSQGTSPSSGSVTPPSIAQQSDPALDLQVKNSPNAQQQNQQQQTRPMLAPGSNTSRYSVSGMSGLGAPSITGKSSIPLSKYAPRVHNVSENSWVRFNHRVPRAFPLRAHCKFALPRIGAFQPLADPEQVYQKTLLIHGAIGESGLPPIDGNVVVSRYDDGFPPISWPVCESHFKALVYLQPGPNKFRLDFSSPKLANSSSSNPIHASYLTLHMLPTMNAPPLQLGILLGKDSPATFDAVPARAEREGNGLETAIRKFRMAAYLWQAFTAEQMWRHRLGRRVFRFEEEWTLGSSNYRDRENGIMRSEARVHVIRSDKTVAELRDLNRAQQNEKATEKDALFGIAADADKNYFNPLPGQKNYVSVLLLDAHWDASAKTITGHAALGGNAGDLHLAVFGSHCLQSYPSSFEEVVPAFTDCTPTDTKHVANDCSDAGSSWEAANIGIGAHLHETGHLFGCPHQENGIMLRDYVVLNRSFVPREAYSTRTKSKGGLALQGDECGWHRLDALRFRAHAAFRLPNDPPMNQDESVQAFATETGSVLVMAATGISFVEIFGEGDDVCHAWIELPADNSPVQRQVTLHDQDLRARLPAAKKKDRLSISIKSHGGGSLTIDDVKAFTSKESFAKLGNGKAASRSIQLGESKMERSESQDVVFTSAVKQDRVMSRIIVYHGSAIDGLEFVYDDDSTQLFGKRGGKAGGDVLEFDRRRGEYLSGFVVRAGFWIDGVQILTSLGRKSPMFGNAHGGSAHTLITPRGYSICGVSGSSGPWVDGFSVLIKR
ncbi:putative zinc metalloproteinase [Tolypocladium ophioglossoides CBS 100239]|uniref:Putative zinc metalloproteinase n=1 Tax=Tolypocladium ophioglossoides (strain CBS 100239) TaxID=1163406 RepID=A0A0L0NH18_TOLOC|nr:putative zinc metalloproteinase [Tolypocladium ophioglossoides CBS 100239]